jgi:OmpA-OmpF porin, OOP family
MHGDNVMKPTIPFILAAAVAMILQACSSTPEPIAELEAARAAVPKVEASPRAGVAATYISDARKALDRANELAEKDEDLADIQYEANIASKNAAIANERITVAEARDELEKATLARQQVLLEARTRQAQSLENELKELKKTDRGLVMTLGDVLFDTGQATLKPGAYATIDQVAAALKQSNGRKVLIEGHTDSVGATETNRMLSERRAAAVQSALLQRGVSSSQITTAGRGEDVPVASNTDPGGRQQNRRVELVFTEGPSKVASD